jgi:cyclopropane-fatty-acyl-phospholipid synthase
MNAEGCLQKLLRLADIQLNGNRPEDIVVVNPGFYRRVLTGRSLALGESYMEGWWQCQALDQFFAKLLRARLSRQFTGWSACLTLCLNGLSNRQSKHRSHRVADIHYDLGNEFYRDMLGPSMQYTCAYWAGAKDLDQAQERKLDLVCRKLQLQPKDRVLELGGGWGGFARVAAERYGCHVTSYNISREQVAYARQWNRGLPVTIVERDYRDATGSFDKVVSMGLCEHVGHKNHRRLMEVKSRCLKNDGLMLLHTIGRNTETTITDPWIDKYIFPGGLLPCLKQLSAAAEGLFVLEDLHSFGPDYDRALVAWHRNHRHHWPERGHQFGPRFDRMWTYYLLSCAGGFRSRQLQLWQLVFSKKGVVGGYTAAR